MKKQNLYTRSIVSYYDAKLERKERKLSPQKKFQFVGQPQESYLGTLPGLRGSEKQVSWAENLRNQALVAISEAFKTVMDMSSIAVDSLDQHILLIIIEGYHWCFKESHITAEWWIDARPENNFTRNQHWERKIHTEIERHVRQMEPGYTIWYRGMDWSYREPDP